MLPCMCMAFLPLTLATLAVFLAVLGYVYCAVKYFQKKRKRQEEAGEPRSVAFFHPYCNAGGGGERVLWVAVKAVQTKFPKWRVVIYTGDLNASPEAILKKVRQTFDIKIADSVQFIYLHQRRWLEPERYPYFTLICQSLGSVVLGVEALTAFLPDIYIDTMGWSFTLPLFKYIGGCTTACYIHYPTISTDMLKRVISRDVTLTNKARVARSPFLSFTKWIYYKIFAKLYSWCGSFSDSVMVNSSWTEDHINTIWSCCASGAKPTHRIYPPCDTKALKAMPMAPDISEGGPIKIVSLGQFRPEKNHPLQLKSMYELRQIVSETVWDRIKLVIVGSCRDKEDFDRVMDMKDFCKHLSLENNVEFKLNVPFDELKQELCSSMIGMHAMHNEHFGISVVEGMAAGQFMVANRSGGPKADIVETAEGSRTGFLASDECEYARSFAAIINMTPSARTRIREAARSSVDRFSQDEFEKSFLRTVEPLFSQYPC